jgi:hypothetical protein
MYEMFNKDTSKPFDNRWDVTNELYGWKKATSKMLGKIESVGLDKEEVEFAALRYQTASQLNYALGRNHQVYSLFGGFDQFDLWQDFGKIAGKNIAIMVDDRFVKPLNEIVLCDKIEKIGEYTHYRKRYLARQFTFFICRNFQKTL